MLTPFINWWIGDNYVLDISAVDTLVLASFVLGMNQITSLFRSSMGFFSEVKFVPFLASVFNIIFSLLFGKIWGLPGVYAATSVSRILTYNLFDPMFVIGKGFNGSLKRFYLKTIVYYLVYFCSVFGIRQVVELISVEGFIGVILKAILSFCLINAVIIAVFCRTEEFNMFIKRGVNIVRNIMKIGGVN
jgi:hypothetical protein